MEQILTFGLGMVTVIFIGMVVALVRSQIQISRLKTQCLDLESTMSDVFRQCDQIRAEINSQIEMVYRQLAQDTDKFYKQIDELHRDDNELHNLVHSRVDKLDNRLSGEIDKLWEKVEIPLK